MTISVSILVPDGIVLATDSRQVVNSLSGQMRVDSDNATKIYQLGSHSAAIIVGQGSFYFNRVESPQPIGEILVNAFADLPKNTTVRNIANILHQKISSVLKKHCRVTKDNQSRVIFYIAGYNAKQNTGELYRCEAPGNAVLARKTNDAGAVWSGEDSYINRLILGYDPLFFEWLSPSENDSGQKIGKGLQLFINFQTMPLQDAVDLATSLVQITINLNKFSNGLVGSPGRFPTCGGKIDVAVITRLQGFQWLSHDRKITFRIRSMLAKQVEHD